MVHASRCCYDSVTLDVMTMRVFLYVRVMMRVHPGADLMCQGDASSSEWPHGDLTTYTLKFLGGQGCN